MHPYQPDSIERILRELTEMRELINEMSIELERIDMVLHHLVDLQCRKELASHAPVPTG